MRVKAVLCWFLRGVIALAGLVVLLLVVLFVTAQRYPKPSGEALDAVLFTSVNVVDVDSGTVAADRALRVREGRIVEVLPARNATRKHGEALRDVGGAYVIPGLWDMHAHLLAYNLHTAAPAMVMNGVLYIRELGSDCAGDGCGFGQDIGESIAIRQAVQRGEILAPYYTELSSYMTRGRRKGQSLPQTPAYHVPRTAEEGRDLARYFAARGVKFIKTYNSTEPDAYRGMLAEAVSTPDFYLGGHVPGSVPLRQALDLGHRSVEHARRLPLACSAEEKTFTSRYAVWATTDDDSDAPALAKRYANIVDTFDPDACDTLLAHWAHLDSVYVPTHITRRAEFTVHTRAYEKDPRTRYVPEAAVSASWAAEAREYEEQFRESPSDLVVYRRFFEHGLALTARAYEHGVKILVGTDAGDMLVYPGFSYQDETALYAQAGIPAAAILRMATLDAAEFSRMADEHGSIAAGKSASLVFLDRDPTQNIEALRGIRAVYHQSAFYDADAREAELAEVKKNARGIGQFLTLGWLMLTEVLPEVVLSDGSEAGLVARAH